MSDAFRKLVKQQFPESPELSDIAGEPPEYPHTAQYRRLKTCSPPEIASEEQVALQVSLNEAREMIEQGAIAYSQLADPAHVLLVKAAPGSGKTTIAVQLAEQIALHGWRVLYAGPRHDFFGDVTLLARHPEIWMEWLPRQAGSETKIETCRHAASINLWLAKGYHGIDFCRGVCGWDVVNGSCVYHAQARTKASVIFGQHQHVWGGHPLDFRMVIGDESPLSAFCHEWVIHGKYIMPADMDIASPVTELMHELSNLAGTGTRMEGRVLINAIGGARQLREALEAETIPIDVLAAVPECHNPGDAERAPYFHLPNLLPLLLREAKAVEAGQEYPARVVLANGSLILLLRRHVSDQMPRHIIWLDATANRHLYEAILQRPCEVIEPRVKMLGKIHQIYDRANGKGALTDGKGNIKAVIKDLKKQVAAVAGRYENKRVGLITHMAIVKQFPDYVDKLCQLGHFYAERGTNRFEDCAALIVAGVPQPPIFEIDKHARMLFQERMRPFSTGKILPWSIIDKPYNYVASDGQGRAYPSSGFWGDADLAAILWQYREAELIQAAHRIRPNLQNRDIWLLENLPVDELPPTELLSLRELFGAPVGMDVFEWPKMKALADECHAEGRKLSGQDIADQLHVKIQTARRYLKKLLEIEPDEWQIESILPCGHGGRPQQQLKPKMKSTKSSPANSNTIQIGT